MEFLLVFPLMLAFSTGQSYSGVTEQASDSCYALCPAGYYRVGLCNDAVKKYSCKRCDGPTYTDRENSALRCERCGSCNHNQRKIRPCLFNQSVLCDCEEGFYNSSTDPDNVNCLECPSNFCQGPDDNEDYIRKCKPCQSKECLKHPEWKKKCSASTNASTSTTTPATTSTTTRATTTATRTSTLNSTSPVKIPVVPPHPENLVLLYLLCLVVIFLVLYWLWLLFCRNPTTKSCICWNANEDVELPVKASKLSEQCSHQGSTMTTLALNISEGTPMMTLSPSAAPDHPAHNSPLLPDAEHKAARQDHQSEHWPAIVLYAIIKEVPLRRWKEFLRLLSVADQQLERVELEAGLGQGSMERQYQMLRLWSQRPSASMNDVFSALHHMDLSGCAQLLQESLEKLQGRPEVMQGFTA
ncbi:tumor necrosis factor receptor superfamily member 1A [Pempheris klunzingeri]|uniref:tumor necrosis factor receptor superfamily member 1A n=1 Tax=Pempheris klunzingeri TaxID=3127111 RepID=UPI0039802948